MGPKLKTAEEEKKTKLYQHMYNTGAIYNNSTIEHAAKPTGISAMIIKNIVQSLVDDNLVDTDKIGSSTYYWVFKSKLSQNLLMKQQNLQKQIKEKDSQISTMNDQLEKLKVQKQQSDATVKLHEELEQLKKQFSQKEKELEERQQFAPDKYEHLEEIAQIIIQETNTVTDNTFTIRKFLESKFNLQRSEADKLLHITEAFDYIE